MPSSKMHLKKRKLENDTEDILIAREKRIMASRNQARNQLQEATIHQHIPGVYGYADFKNTAVDPTLQYEQRFRRINLNNDFNWMVVLCHRDELIAAEWLDEWESAGRDAMPSNLPFISMLAEPTDIDMRLHAREAKEVRLNHYDVNMEPQGRQSQVVQDKENEWQKMANGSGRRIYDGVGRTQIKRTPCNSDTAYCIHENDHDLRALRSLPANIGLARERAQPHRRSLATDDPPLHAGHPPLRWIDIQNSGATSMRVSPTGADLIDTSARYNAYLPLSDLVIFEDFNH